MTVTVRQAKPRVGMGCMRLSTDPGRDETRALLVLHAAFDAGVTLLDTADAYCLDAGETGHNERLIAKALASWPGDASRMRVATKGGLTRLDGRWVPDGRAKHLAAACDASCRALGVDRLPLYQLHAPDPRVPFATSVRALRSLQRAGRIAAIGLCNVTVGQIEEARRIADIASVQVALGPWEDASVRGGVVHHCLAEGLEILAYRPLGGPQRARRAAADPLLAELAASYGATPCEVILAWLCGLSDLVVPIPGPTRVETAHSLRRVLDLELSEADRERLDARFPAGRVRSRRAVASAVAAGVAAQGEVVLLMGLPGAGKSTLATTLEAQGFERLNRDTSGGTLAGLLPALDRLLASGPRRVVLDNTYLSRQARASVVAAAAARGCGVRCVWLDTSLEDAQVNAATRIVTRHGRLLSPEEMQAMARTDVTAFGPAVQFRGQRELEPPDPAEGFARIERVAFERRRDPAFTNRAVIVWCDGILMRDRDADGEVVGERAATLCRHRDEGWLVLGLSWQPGVAEGTHTHDDVTARFARLRERLGIAIEIEYCPHAAGPPVCWCRKPLPGLGVVFIRRHRLDPARCVYVGAGPQDPGFARRLGFRYVDARTFFGDPGVSR